MTEQDTLLIADDAEINRAILRGLFEGGYNLLEAENGEQALLLLGQYSSSVALVLLDLTMPGMDGYEVMEEMARRESLSHIPVVIITADDSADSKVRVFELGASDIITKPFEPDVVKSRVKNVLELSRHRRHLEELVEEQAASLRESSSAVIDLLSSVIEYRSLESGQHIRRIRLFTKILLEDVAASYREYNLDERRIRLITDASSMHDIGKIAIPDSILNKPGKLTGEEFEVMKTHTLRGCEILTGLDRLQDREYLQYAYHICRYHHERWDGRGYPDALKGDSIPICAQVVAIADCYDALTTDRVYKKAIPQQQAFNMILNGECGAFSPRLLESFKNVREQFARLSREYADGLGARGAGLEERLLPGDTLLWEKDSTLEQSQLKYFALLRHLDSTVMEVDCATGMYHLVYLADQDFAALRTGSSFEEAIRAFAGECVHPQDREKVLALLGGYIQELFDEGLTRRTRRYRVKSRAAGGYVWCQASLLRTDLENPRQRKVLLVWQKEQPQGAAPAPSQGQPEILNQLLGGVLKCRNDRYFTLVQPSRGLLDLVGYTQQELTEKFAGHYLELVHPADRGKLCAQFGAQRNAGKAIELEYRLVAKNGESRWVSDRCTVVQERGEEYVLCVLLDVTRPRLAEESLRLSLERHQIIMEQTNDIIFEWDVVRDELHFSSNWEAQYGYKPITKNVRTEIPRASHIHPQDVPVFMGLMEAMTAGVPYKEIEFRLADAQGKYRWRRVRATAQYDEDGKPSKAVGVLIDIDDQKRASAKLQFKAERDALTGLYNRNAAHARVEKYLGECAPGETCALLIVDVDNFKQVNDRYGHMFGDAVLVRIAERITGLFRGEDTVARIGGDEFLVFMPGLRDKGIAGRRAGQLIDTVRQMLRENLEDVPLSCSVGLAYAAGQGGSFKALFEQADRALYRAKAAGKNRFMAFSDEMRGGDVGILQQELLDLRTQIDSDRPAGSYSQIILRAFDILYGAPDLEQAIGTILEFAGGLFDVSRAYIFERAPDGAAVNTYEWCAQGVAPCKGAPRGGARLPRGGKYWENFLDDGIFYCPDVARLHAGQRAFLEARGVLSTLQCAIRDGGEFKGFVGFDDCAVRRLWTRAQIDTLTFLGKLLSIFLLKNRAQRALCRTVENLHSVLDHQEVWLYVLDPATYTLRYVNRKTRELVPKAREGKRCYEVFYQRGRPCENCVMEEAVKNGENAVREFYNPQLRLWVLADASMVGWDDARACLIACRDISAYKGGPPAGQEGAPPPQAE